MKRTNRTDKALLVSNRMKTKIKTTAAILLTFTFITLQTFNSFAQTNGVDAGNCLQFDGVDDYVLAKIKNLPKNTFTIEAWIKTYITHEVDIENTVGTSGTTGQKYLFRPSWIDAPNCGAGVSVGTNGISVYEHSASYMPAVAVYSGSIDTNWNHIVVVYDNKTPYIYLNGNLVRTGKTSTRDTIYAPKDFGGYTYGYLAGMIDNVRLWNIALTQNEINTYRCMQVKGNETGLVAYWQLNEDSSKIAYDSSPNENNATLINMDTLTAWVPSDAIGQTISLDIEKITDFCQGDTLTLDAGDGFTSYLWQDSSTAQTLNVTTSGTYWVSVSDSSCSTTDSVTITENPLPVINLGNDITLCTGMDTVLDAGSGYASYAWSTGANTNTITVSSANTYSVTVTDTNGCSANDAVVVTVSICSGIEDGVLNPSSMFQVFPNPSDGNFELEILNSKLGIKNAEIRIYNIVGEEVYQQTINSQHAMLNTKLPNGIYNIQIITNEGMWNERIIVN